MISPDRTQEPSVDNVFIQQKTGRPSPPALPSRLLPRCRGPRISFWLESYEHLEQIASWSDEVVGGEAAGGGEH